MGAPGFLKLAEEVPSESWILKVVVDCPEDTELLVLLDKP